MRLLTPAATDGPQPTRRAAGLRLDDLAIPVWFVAGVAVVAALRLWMRSGAALPWDFAINYTASTALTRGVGLYAGEPLRDLAHQIVGPWVRNIFSSTFDSYIGPPTTATILLPFTLLPFATSIVVYRAALIGAFLSAVLITGYAVAPSRRRIAWAVGFGCLALWNAPLVSVQLGQVDAWIALGLAVGVVGLAHRRDGLSGAGFAVAALLKLTPAVIIVYLLIASERRKVGILACTIASALCLSSALFFNTADWMRFGTHVLPSLSSASITLQNVSLPAWIARLSATGTDVVQYTNGLGLVKLVALPILAVTWAVLWSAGQESFSVRHIAVLILAVLVAGPLTWDHYLSWAVVAVVVITGEPETNADGRLLRPLMLTVGLVILHFAVRSSPPATIPADWRFRFLSGAPTLSIVLLLVCSLPRSRWTARPFRMM